MKFEQNLMVRTVQNFELFDRKWLTIFDKVLNDISNIRSKFQMPMSYKEIA